MKKNKILTSMVLSVAIISMCTINAFAVEGEHKDVLFGDMNRDNAVNIADSTELQKYVTKISDLEDLRKVDLSLLDINGDGDVTVVDATYIQKCIVKASHDSNIGKAVYKWHEPTYKTVHHEASEKKKWVVDKKSYTYDKTEYVETSFNICNDCRKILDYDLGMHYFFKGHACDGKTEIVQINEGTTEQVATDKLEYVKAGFLPSDLIKPMAAYQNSDKTKDEVVFKKTNVDMTKLTEGAQSPYFYYAPAPRVDKDGDWDYSESYYRWSVDACTCSKCGEKVVSDMMAHLVWEVEKNGGRGSYHCSRVVVPITKTITVPEKGHWETVKVPAWNEKVLTDGYWEKI